MDSEHVALVDLRLKRAGFARYTCERKLSFSVPMRGLHKIVRAATTNKQLTMRASARDDQVHLRLRPRSARSRARCHRLVLMWNDWACPTTTSTIVCWPWPATRGRACAAT
uniref:Proliferating cell nuclear antigen n=1 Tax=Spilarctia obliqua nucleopolyhedrovirus TaxID=1638618 RepID=A0A7G9U8I7_9ABAC|nr:proliferating cell nuclear antigen [Spilarctia obliqua nucleopolyhedrovirus]